MRGKEELRLGGKRTQFETWGKALENKETGSYRITVSGEERKNSPSKRNKK